MEISPTASDLLSADGLQIRQTRSSELLRRFALGWSQYVELLTLDDSAERRFYEIDPAATADYVRYYREMWEEDSVEEEGGK